MNNIIQDIEERALAAQPPKMPCRKCGKPISGRGKRMHDLFCYGSKKTSQPFSGQYSTPKAKSFSRPSTLKSFAPSSVVHIVFSTYSWALDYCFKAMNQNLLWSWFWASLFIFLLVLPFYFAFSIFIWVERLFALVIILWKFTANWIGFTVGATQQLNLLADKIGQGAYAGTPQAIVNYLTSQVKDGDQKKIEGVVGDVVSSVSNAFQMAVTTDTAVAAIDKQALQIPSLFPDWLGFGTGYLGLRAGS